MGVLRFQAASDTTWAGSPQSISLPFTPASGAGVVVALSMSVERPITGVTDNESNTWTISQQDTFRAIAFLSELTGTAPTSISVAFNDSGGNSSFVVPLFYELDEATTQVRTGTSESGFGTSHSITIATDATTDVIIGHLFFQSGTPNANTLTAIGGAVPHTTAASAVNPIGWYGDDLGAAGSKTLGFSWPSGGNSGNLNAVVFSQAAASGPTITQEIQQLTRGIGPTRAAGLEGDLQ